MGRGVRPGRETREREREEREIEIEIERGQQVRQQAKEQVTT